MRGELGISLKEVQTILQYQIDNGMIHLINDMYFTSETLEKCRIKLLHHLSTTRDCIGLGQLRDLLGNNRSTCINLLAIFETEGIITRTEDKSIMITSTGKLWASGKSQGQFENMKKISAR